MIQHSTKSILFFFALAMVSLMAGAQTSSVSGTVTDERDEPVSYATVVLEGTSFGANTDDDGKFTLADVPAGSYVFIVSYVGYSTFKQDITVGASPITMNVKLVTDYIGLDEVVVVGYGTKQLKDLTGSVTSVGEDDFLEGLNTSPEQLISGRVAGVQIISSGGMPGASSRIRIRGGASLNASNDPLIVVDGVPVDNNGINGSANALNLINPNDIENITILKDASAAAIYGSRAANGVILITTKKGSSSDNKFRVEFTTINSIANNSQSVPVFTADELRAIVNETGDQQQKDLLGDATTDWQSEIYRTAFSTDNFLAFSGGIKKLPYRFSLGYLVQNGVLERSQMSRPGLSLNLGPSFLKNHLKVDVNTKLAYTHNFFAEQGTIGAAVTFDPTQPVYSDTSYLGGYFEWLDPNTGKPNVLAPKNPVGLLYQKDDISNVYRFIGNIQLDYQLHFFPDVRANLNLGGDFARSDGTVFIPEEAASNFSDTLGGRSTQYEQEKNNKLLEFYLNYSKSIEKIKSDVDFTAGYSYQDWIRSNPAFPTLSADGGEITPAGTPFKTQNTLISFYGRLNYTLMNRYLLTVTLRDDGSSRFSPDNRWGLFPSAAVAWRISDESFLVNSNFISNLKLRLGYGLTGQQDVLADYPYIANYNEGQITAQYQFGNTFYPVLRPDGYDANIKWEETKTYNAGLDFGFINGRINGSIDVYRKETSDLLATIPIPAGSNFTNRILTNVGSLENSGVELMLEAIPYDNKNFSWTIGTNLTLNRNEITNLTKIQDPDDPGILVGGIAGGINNTIQVHSVGYSTFTYYAYEQLYDEDGKPIEGEYADLNDDGIINQEDRYRIGNPEPDVYAAFYSNFNYKKWSGGFSLRGSFGNEMYNNVYSNLGNYTNIDGSKNYLNNLSENYNESEFVNPQYLSDYYIYDASFVRCDNIFIGYNFGKILKDRATLKLSAIVQNVFVISDYPGLDPEIAGGIDNNIYPRPRIFSLNVNLKL